MDQPDTDCLWTERQRRFVEEYLVDRNATQAAIRAGYNREGAAVQGHRLLRHRRYAHVHQAIKLRLEAKDYEALRQRIINERANIAFANPFDLLPPEERTEWMDAIPAELKAAVKEIVTTEFHDKDGQLKRKVAFKLWSKNEALTALEKITSLVNDRVDHRADINISAARAELEAIIANLGPPDGEPGGEGVEGP